MSAKIIISVWVNWILLLMSAHDVGLFNTVHINVFIHMYVCICMYIFMCEHLSLWSGFFCARVVVMWVCLRNYENLFEKVLCRSNLVN